MAGWLSPFCFARETHGGFFIINHFHLNDSFTAKAIFEMITDTGILGNKLTFTDRTNWAAFYPA